MLAKLTSIFGENLGLKVLALSLALMLELYFYSPDNSVMETLPALVRFSNITSNFMIVDPVNAKNGIEANIEVRGPRPIIRQMRSEVIKISVKAPRGALPGTFPLRVDAAAVSVPSGVEVLRVAPLATSVTVETRVGKEIIIVVESVGAPAQGFALKEINVFPDTVVVKGPKSKVENLAAIETLALEIDGVKKSFSQEISLKPQDSLIDVGVTLVTVDVVIEEKHTDKKFEEVRIELLAPTGYGATLEGLSLAKVVLSGPVNILDSLTSSQIRLYADARQKTQGEHRLSLSGDFPEGLQVKSISPENVIVKIRGENG